RPGPDRRVHCVEERDELAFGLPARLEYALEPLLELAAVLGPGDHRAEIESDDALVLQTLGNVAGGDPTGETLDDGGLADTRLADEDRVVLGPPRQDLDDTADLVVPADDRVELALTGNRGEVAPVLLECVQGVLRVLRGDPPAASDTLQRIENRLGGHPPGAEEVPHRAAVVDESEDQVLDGQVGVAETLPVLVGRAQDPARGGPERDLGVAVDLGLTVETALQGATQGQGVGTHRIEQRVDDP